MAKGTGKGKGKRASKAKAAPKRAKKAKTSKATKKRPRSKGSTSKKQKRKAPEHDEDEELHSFEPPKGDRWTSPVSYDAKSFSTLIRRSLDELEFKYTRKQADKMYTQTMILFPLPKSAYVYRFEIKWPVEVWIDLYDTKPSHAGIIPFMDIHGLTPKKLKPLRDLFEHVIGKNPRPPWQFTIGQRLQHGLLIPEWGRAKKAWRKLGFRLEKWKVQR